MIRFENQGTYTYLVYEVEENDVIDNVSLNMLIKNKIPGLANTLFTQMDTNRYIKYNVSSKVTAKQFMAGVVNRKKLLSFFKGIIDGYMSIDDYMLSTDQIVMDLDYIFTDVSTGDTYLICIPLQNRSFSNEDMPSFLKKVMFSTNFDQNENCDHVAKIINYLNSSSSFSLESFRNLLKEIEGGTGAAQHAAPQPSPAKLTKSPVPAQPVMPKPVQPAVQPPVQPPVQQSQAAVKPPVSAPAAPPKFQVPDISVKSANTANDGDTGEGKEKKMSMFYLLQHYNKENAELYKAQKAQKKASAKDTAGKSSSVGFAVPGTGSSSGSNSSSEGTPSGSFGFAIPGKGDGLSTKLSKKSGGPGLTLQKDPVAPPPAPPAPPSAPAQPKIPGAAPVMPSAMEQPLTTPVSVMPQQSITNFGETTVLNMSGADTTVLNPSQLNAPSYPYLIRAKYSEKIMINKPVFKIGKERSYVDYFIGDNTAISRSHANIITKDNKYFVMDTNSTNHTYLNGMMIQSNVEYELTDGAKVRFANEEFEFKLN